KTCGTDALAERNYYGLQLSAAGELAARTGQVGDLFKLLDEFSHAHPEYFNRTLEWLIELSRRHDEVQFGLVCLKFTNVHLLASKLPRHRLAQMFDALAQRLRALIRTTDLFMRDDDEYCWLLLPQTPPGGVAMLLERIAALGAAAAGSGLAIRLERHRPQILSVRADVRAADPGTGDARRGPPLRRGTAHRALPASIPSERHLHHHLLCRGRGRAKDRPLAHRAALRRSDRDARGGGWRRAEPCHVGV